MRTHQIPGLGEVVGYLDSSTALCGQRLSVHLSSTVGPTRVRLRALRIGDYQGKGSRLVWQSGEITARQQREAEPTGPDRVITERWPVATTIAVDASWPPGMYLVQIAPLAGGRPSYIPLVVRTSGERSPYLVVASDLTWLGTTGTAAAACTSARAATTPRAWPTAPTWRQSIAPWTPAAR